MRWWTFLPFLTLFFGCVGSPDFITMRSAGVQITSGDVLGSGSVVSSSAILTADHVVKGQSDFTVTFADGTKGQADILAEFPDQDIALLKLRDTTKIQPSEISCRAPVLGEQVVAVGTPLGLQNIVMPGTVASTDNIDGQGVIPGTVLLIMPLNHGNSGGGVYDANGKIIGVADVMITAELQSHPKSPSITSESGISGMISSAAFCENVLPYLAR